VETLACSLSCIEGGWNANEVVKASIRDKGLTPSFIAKWKDWFERAVEDPKVLWSSDAPEELIKQLIEKNLIIYNMHHREQQFWVDQPPPERDQELGVDRYIARQMPLHREAVRQALRETSA